MLKKYRKNKSPKKTKTTKVQNVRVSVLLTLFMDGSGKCKPPSTPPSTGLSRLQHLNMVIVNFEF